MSIHVADEIAKFTQPTPQIVDYEDDLNSESNAKLIEKSFDVSEDIPVSFSKIRRKTDLLLHERDSKYAGKKISRQSLENYDEYYDEDSSCCSSDQVASDGDTNADTKGLYDCTSSVGEDVISSFKELLASKGLGSCEKSMHDSENVESSHNEDGLHVEEEESESEEESDPEETEENDTIQKFSGQNVANEVDKGHAVKAQQELWFKLCECRIKIQKLLLAANKMPQFYDWSEFKARSGDVYQKDLNKAWKKIKKLLNCCVDFQTELLKSNVPSVAEHSKEKDMPQSDEEILSDEFSGSDIGEEEKSENLKINDAHTSHSKSVKRKHSEEYYNEVMAKRHGILETYRNSVIETWDKKTKLTSGCITQKSFNMFDQTTVVDQIKQILSDKQRLVKRTQIKRADYQVLGKDNSFSREEEDITVTENKNTIEKKKNIVSSEKEHDPEIFDDEDFYRQLLKDIIESKSVSIDPIMFGKQLEIQRARSKMKRKVDTKASKGRKIRFDVHPKLVNFMAPITNSSMTSDAKDELFLSLFGQHRTLPVVK